MRWLTWFRLRPTAEFGLPSSAGVDQTGPREPVNLTLLDNFVLPDLLLKEKRAARLARVSVADRPPQPHTLETSPIDLCAPGLPEPQKESVPPVGWCVGSERRVQATRRQTPPTQRKEFQCLPKYIPAPPGEPLPHLHPFPMAASSVPRPPPTPTAARAAAAPLPSRAVPLRAPPRAASVAAAAMPPAKAVAAEAAPQVGGANGAASAAGLARPDAMGRFGRFGGKYVPETLMHALTELEAAFHALATDDEFQVTITDSFHFLFWRKVLVVFEGFRSIGRTLRLGMNRANCTDRPP
jgi:hypothetical protein